MSKARAEIIKKTVETDRHKQKILPFSTAAENLSSEHLSVIFKISH